MHLGEIFGEKPTICSGKKFKLLKTWLVMKMTIILIVLACLQVNAKTYSQRITLAVNNVPLENVFKNIKSQTGYIFFTIRS